MKLSLEQRILRRLAKNYNVWSFLLRLEFIDSITEGGEAFLRLDFWNSLRYKRKTNGLAKT